MITLKIKLKNKFQKFEIEFENKKYLEEFFEDLENKNIIKIGPIIFNKNDFKYAIIQEK